MMLALLDDRPPVPPADLILRIAASFDAADIDQMRAAFDLGGLDHLRSFERGLAGIGRSFAEFQRMLDFGCGCGRFLRHFGGLAGQLEIHGTDIDAEMIAWCRENIAFGRFELAPHQPPLPYPDHQFDLVINHSVFTHLDERHQDLWLAELQRITRPDAVLLLTVEGATSWNRTREASERVGENPERWRQELETRGMVFISDDHFVGSTHPDFYHSAIHAPWYVFEHWSRFFDLAAYLPDGSATQDLIVLRRRADGAPAPRPIGHRSAAGEAPGPGPRRRARSGGLLSRGRSAGQRLMQRRRTTLAQEGRSGQLDAETVAREINMLRAGLYEQGNRMSVLAAQLRDEIESLRNGRGGSGS